MKDHQPSATARFVASGVSYVATDSSLGNEVPDRMRELNRTMLSACDGSLSSRWKAGMLQRFSIPGIYPHFVLRKRWIEKRAKEAVADGATQLVILGAGLDTLSLRLNEMHPNLQCLEIDHPATQQLKRKAVAKLVDLPTRPHFLELDLTKQTMQECLLESDAYDPQAQTLFVAEGLFMYLLEKDVREVFHFVRDHSGPESSIIFTFMKEQSPGNYQFGNESALVKLWLKVKHETFLWGLPLESVADFTESNGLSLISMGGESEFRTELLAPEHRNILLAEGEQVAWARVNP